jgi:putative acetyltransferase
MAGVAYNGWPFAMEIRIDDLTGPEIAAFLDEHLRDMRSVSPPESTHALDLDGLKKPDVTFWTVWDNQQLVGCGAIKELNPAHGEIKSMRTTSTHRRRGVATVVLQHILRVAKERGYRRLSLETGSMPFFEPARRLYRSHGFEECAPFADYREDPNSVFLTKDLTRS